MWVCAWVYCLQRPGRALESLEQELKVAVSFPVWGLGTEFKSLTRAVCALIHWALVLDFTLPPLFVCLCYKVPWVARCYFILEDLPSTVDYPWHCHYYLLRETDMKKTAFPLNPSPHTAQSYIQEPSNVQKNKHEGTQATLGVLSNTVKTTKDAIWQVQPEA